MAVLENQSRRAGPVFSNARRFPRAFVKGIEPIGKHGVLEDKRPTLTVATLESAGRTAGGEASNGPSAEISRLLLL